MQPHIKFKVNEMAGSVERPVESIVETGCRLCVYAPASSSSLPASRRQSLLAAASAARAKDGDAGDAPVDIDEQEAPGWRGAFSAQWDPNNPRQLYVCSQNGLLKVVDVESAKEKTYQVLFRTFSASIISGSQTECKPLRYHWDKMSIVYGKPGEFFFLMGVSNTVYFSALPGSGSVLASLTNADMPDFVNGTPVLQIYSHASRVTAMASCPVAEVFVSGDESGELSVISFIPDPANKLKSEWWSSPSATPNHLNPLVRAHNAPIFSLVWLSVLHVEKNRDRVVYMASGSEDRMVKLWKVTCDLQKSVAVTPLMVLDTISTHMLSLACLPHYRDGKDQANQSRAKAPSANNSYFDDTATATRSMLSFLTQQTIPKRIYNDIYIAGGTSAGSVYVWKIDASDINSSFEDVSPTIDDGNRLVAIVDCSERPVVHLSMYYRSYEDEEVVNMFADAGRSGRKSALGGSQASLDSPRSRSKTHRMVMAASDTSSIVRLYLHHAPDIKLSKYLQPTMKTRGSRAGSPFGRRANEASHQSHGPEDIEGLVLMGEAQLQEPVVGCLFTPDVESPATLKSQLEGRQVDKSDSLVVCLASGEIRFYSNRALLTPKLGSVLDGLPDTDADDSSVGEIAGNAERRGAVEIAKRRNASESDEESATPFALKAPYPSINREAIMKTAVKPESVDVGPTFVDGAYKGQAVPNPSLSRVSDKPPLVNIVPADQGNGGSKQGFLKKVTVSETVSTHAQIIESQEKNSHVVSPTIRSKLIKETKLQPKAETRPHTSPSAAVIRHRTTPGNQSSTAAAETSHPTESNRTSGPAISGVAPSLQAVRNLKQFKKSQTKSAASNSPSASGPVMPVSELADPVIHSSKVLADRYRGLADAVRLASQGERASDDASIETTLSQRQIAANAATNVAASVNQKPSGMYSDLISIDSEALLKHMPAPISISKQVDPEWLRRRRTEGPTGKELSVLYTKDVAVEVRLEGKGWSGRNDSLTSSVQAADFHGLSASMDKSTMEFSYTLRVDPVEVFDAPVSYLSSTGKKTRELPCWREVDELSRELDESVFL